MKRRWKKAIAVILAASMVMSLSFTAFAEEAPTEAPATVADENPAVLGTQSEGEEQLSEKETLKGTENTGDQTENTNTASDQEQGQDPQASPEQEEPAPEEGKTEEPAPAEAAVNDDSEAASAEAEAPAAEASVPAADGAVAELGEASGTPAQSTAAQTAGKEETKEEGQEEAKEASAQEVAEMPEEVPGEEIPVSQPEAAPMADDTQAIYNSLSVNYTKLLPREFFRIVSINETDYKLNWEKIPVNFSVDSSDKNYYKPGEATIKQLNLSTIAGIEKKNDKDLMMFVEYYDSNPQYDARLRGWDKVYTRIKKEGKNKPKGSITDPVAGNATLSNSVSINVALVWMKISENGVPIVEEKPEILQGVRINTVTFKNGKNATISSNGQWLPYALKKSSYQDNSVFSLQLAHVKRDSGLTAKQLRNINKALKWKKNDNENTRFLFGVTRRELAGSGQYDKLTYKIRNGKIDTRKGKLEIKGVKIRIRFKNGGADTTEGAASSTEVKNSYMNKFITVKLPPQKKITEKPREDVIKYGAYIKEFDEDKLVVEGVGNFCGTAYWIRNSETGTFSLAE